jgi:hypothetical protein
MYFHLEFLAEGQEHNQLKISCRSQAPTATNREDCINPHSDGILAPMRVLKTSKTPANSA